LRLLTYRATFVNFASGRRAVASACATCARKLGLAFDGPRLLHCQKRLGLSQFGPLGIAVGGQGLQLRIVVASSFAVACGFGGAGSTVSGTEAIGVMLQRTLKLDERLCWLVGGQQHLAQQFPRRYDVTGCPLAPAGAPTSLRAAATSPVRAAPEAAGVDEDRFGLWKFVPGQITRTEFQRSRPFPVTPLQGESGRYGGKGVGRGEIFYVYLTDRSNVVYHLLCCLVLCLLLHQRFDVGHLDLREAIRP